MAFVDASSKLKFEYWFEPEFLGEQWGIGVHDLDGNGYLDFYANHHGQKTGEIIMNFGSDDPTNIYYEIPGDLHGVTFFDIDQDGDADLLQAQGGDKGTTSDPTDPGLFNKVLLNDDGELRKANSVESFGIEYALGRKRLITPVNFDGEIALYVGVFNNRPDGRYSGQFFELGADGYYDEYSPLGRTVAGELATGVHFGDDRFVDVINLDYKKRELRVYENDGSGFEVTRLDTGASQILDVVAGDFDGDLEPEILFGRAGRRDGLFRQDASGDWVDVSSSTTTTFQKSSRVIATGDFNNDGDLDYAALKAFRGQPGVEVHTYLNRGDGSFRRDSVFSDPDIVGQSEFMISGDFNRNGALDLLITNSYATTGGEGMRPGEYTMLEGEPTANNWLSVELRGRTSETGGLGARVYVTTADGKVRVLEQDSGAHFTAQDSTDLHFGLGRHARADVRIVWPDGSEQEIDGVAANRHVVLTEARGAGPAPRPPVAVDDAASTAFGARVVVNVLANDRDPEGEPLRIVDFDARSTAGGRVTIDDRGTAALRDDRLVYAPPEGFFGSDSFEYVVRDEDRLTDTGRVAVSVTPPPRAVFELTAAPVTYLGTAGADVYIVDRPNDSTHARLDRILDFDPTEGDRIDLSALDRPESPFTIRSLDTGKPTEFTRISGPGGYFELRVNEPAATVAPGVVYDDMIL